MLTYYTHQLTPYSARNQVIVNNAIVHTIHLVSNFPQDVLNIFAKFPGRVVLRFEAPWVFFYVSLMHSAVMYHVEVGL